MRRISTSGPAVPRRAQAQTRSQGQVIRGLTILQWAPILYLGMPKGTYKTRPFQFNLRFKPEERELIKEAADKAGQDMSNWIRGVLLRAARRELK